MSRATHQVLPLLLALLGGVACTLAIAVACAWFAPSSMIWGSEFLNEHTGSGRPEYRSLAGVLPESERVVVMSAAGFGHRALDIHYYNASDIERTQYPPLKRRAFQTQIGWPHLALTTNSRVIGRRFGLQLGPNSPADDALLDDGKPTTWQVVWPGLWFDSALFTSLFLGAWLCFRRGPRFGLAPRAAVAAVCLGLWLAVCSAWMCDLAFHVLPAWPRSTEAFTRPESFTATVHPIVVPPAESWDGFSGIAARSVGYHAWHFNLNRSLPNNRMTWIDGGSSLSLGWPLPAFKGERIPPWRITGVRPHESRARHLRGLFALPVHWPGLIVNWILFSIVSMAILKGPGALRRRRRLRNRRCPQCNYPIDVSAVCTECGAALPPVALRR